MIAKRRSSVPLATIRRRIAIVIAGYLGYVGAIWVLEPRSPAALSAGFAATAEASPLAGRQVWLENGCSTCHSLIGLGGHLGPDLTNYGRPELAATVRSTVRSGRSTMPRYSLSEHDLDALLAYLDTVSRSATYPPRSRSESAFGVAP